MRHVVASGHRFELLHDSEKEETFLRHKIAEKSALLSEEDSEMMEDISGTSGDLDREFSALWFQRGYYTKARRDAAKDVMREEEIDEELC